MNPKPIFPSLINRIRQWKIPDTPQLVQLFEEIVLALQDPTKIEWLRGKGAAQKKASMEIQTDGTVYFQTEGSTNALVHSSGARLSAGGAWTNASSIHLKEKFEKLKPSEVLNRVLTLRVDKWRYRRTGTPHIGPFAEDFHEAFGVGEDGQTISPADMAGVALVCIKALAQEITDLRETIGKPYPKAHQKR